MAVMRHSIIFGGVDSADYGIYIGGEGVFNAPQRDVEMIEIPGRNGAFALDRGRFKNIEVTYTAINHEPDLATFSANLEAFRNALASQKGYQRLEDTFHPDEYRMAAFVNGLEIEPIEYNTAAEFEVTFDCKPQRFLTSGETEVTVSSGDTLTNPTLFESSPLLEVEGYGTISFNGYEIELQNVLLGAIEVAPINRHAPLGVNERTYTLTSTFDRALVNT
jgi:phage-related protein